MRIIRATGPRKKLASEAAMRSMSFLYRATAPRLTDGAANPRVEIAPLART